MRVSKWFIVVRGDGSKPRVVRASRQLRLRDDEVAFRFTVKIPETWGCIYDMPAVELPDPPPSVTLDSDAVTP